MILKHSAKSRAKVPSCLVFLLAFPLLMQAQQTKLSPAKLTRIDAEVSNFMATTHVPGVAVAIVGHTGGQQGTSTAFFVAPASRAGVVVLCNMEDVGAGKLAHEKLKIVVAGAAARN